MCIYSHIWLHSVCDLDMFLTDSPSLYVSGVEIVSTSVIVLNEPLFSLHIWSSRIRKLEGRGRRKLGKINEKARLPREPCWLRYADFWDTQSERFSEPTRRWSFDIAWMGTSWRGFQTPLVCHNQHCIQSPFWFRLSHTHTLICDSFVLILICSPVFHSYVLTLLWWVSKNHFERFVLVSSEIVMGYYFKTLHHYDIMTAHILAWHITS